MQNLFCSFFHLFLSTSPPVPPVQYYCSVSCFFCRRGVLLTTITILIGIKREHHWQKGSGFENPSSRIFQLDSILLVSCALSCNVIATNIFLCSECGTRNWKGEIIYFLGWWRTFAMQGGALCGLFCPSAKATFTILFRFFLFPLYIITKAKFVYFVALTSLPLTEMHLNNPCEFAAKAALWMSWQGMLLEACSQETFPGILHLVLILCPSALAPCGTRPPTWMVAFGFHQTGQW